MHPLPHEQVDMGGVEAGPVVEVFLGRAHLQGRGVATEGQSSFLLDELLSACANRQVAYASSNSQMAVQSL